MPEEVAQATMNLQAKMLLPVHCGKFALSPHHWQDPFERIYTASQNKSYKLLTPLSVSYTHLTLPTNVSRCRSRWSPYH